MASVEKRGDKYQVRWWTLAGIQKKRLCPTAGSARALKRDIESVQALGRDWEPEVVREEPAEPEEPTEPNLEQVARAYLEAKALRYRSSTIRMYGTHLDVFVRFLRAKFCSEELSVKLLSRPLLEQFLAWLYQKGTSRHKKGRSSDSAAKLVRAAQLMWAWAEQSDRWPGMVPPPRTIELPRPERQPVVAPSWAEMDACVLACSGWQKKLATWLRYTGLRVGESMLIIWSDIDLETRDAAPATRDRQDGRTHHSTLASYTW